MSLDASKIRKDFPILSVKNRGKELSYLDTAASAQTPNAVVDAIANCYRSQYANVHRGIYHLSEAATAAFESVRDQVVEFIHAPSREEIIFTKGTTEAFNLVATSFGQAFICEGNEIILSQMEHHANIVPWQMLCNSVGAKIKVINITASGELDFEHFESLLSDKTKIVSITHISNVLGTINPVKQIIKIAHEKNIPVMLDGAQAVPHMPVDVQDLDVDFYCFSAHKMYGPTGVGVLYGKKKYLEKMPPYQGGGDMIRRVTFEKTEYNSLPYKFEAGTPNIAGVIGMGAAISYLQDLGYDNIAAHEHDLLVYATAELQKIPGLKIYGNQKDKAAVISFTLECAHSHDVATLLDQEGVAVRAGHHCAMPLMEFYGLAATTRASFGIYNTKEEVDKLILALHKVLELFG